MLVVGDDVTMVSDGAWGGVRTARMVIDGEFDGKEDPVEFIAAAA
jgi:hypothetical protein